MRASTTRATALLALILAVAVSFVLLGPPARASGTLTPQGAVDAPIQILDHHVDAVIQNGFVRVEVQQTFFNPNGTDLEALYAFPVPESAALSEMSVTSGETEIHGEVVPRERARQVYEQERDAGNDAGLAEQQSYQRYEVRVTPVRAGAEVHCRFVYYQALTLDTGVGRWLYPMEDGGTDDAARSFWTTNTRVERSFSLALELKSAWPVDALRLPGFEAVTQLEQLDEGHYKARIDLTDASLDRDIVAYYKLADDLPGRVEVIPFRDDPDGAGTFMLVVTPGIDLKPLDRGADYLFVLDTSGSMDGKLATLVRGVADGLGELDPRDRFRIITFSDRAFDVSRGWQTATPGHITQATTALLKIGSNGGTNLFEGLELALDDVDADRATSLVLVTDGVANVGPLNPQAFDKLMRKKDVRVFGFLMGNSANWPLMRVICDASGGFYAPVSNADDVLGQILMAKSKITHEALHDARLEIDGVDVFDRTDEHLGKVYRGEQIVVFGRYDEPGRATATLHTRITGRELAYTTSFDLPALDTANPELERLWALRRIEELQQDVDLGRVDASEGRESIVDYGVDYQLVTEHTSMLVLADQAFERHGIERRNVERVAREQAARQQRAAQPARNHRVDRNKPAFGGGRSPRFGGGSLDLALLLAVAALIAAGLMGSRKRCA